MEKLLLIDGSSLLHRAFYALPLLHNALGEYTNGVYGFMTMLNRMLTEQNPDYIIICFDKGRITFRNQISGDYKATRKETPSELSNQFEILKEVLSAAGIFWRELAGYEADDLLGTFARQAEQSGKKTLLFSGDNDVLQLIDENTIAYMTKKGISNIDKWDTEKVMAEYSLKPQQLIDLKALMGDASDNISGVPGVGKKTALKLIQQFGSVENLYNNLDQVGSVKLRQKLAEHQDNVDICKKLATIDRQCPVEIDWQECKFVSIDAESLLPIYQRLEFNTLIKALKTKIVSENKADLSFTSPGETGFSAILLTDVDKIKELAGKIKSIGTCAFYFDWQGQALKGQIKSGGISLPDGAVFAIDFSCQKEAIIAALADVFSDPAVKKVTANSKELTQILAYYGYRLSDNFQDVILAAYLLDPSQSQYDVVALAGANGLETPAPAIDPVMEAARKASVLFSLHEVLQTKIIEYGMYDLYQEVELPLAQVLSDMEMAGIHVEGDKLLRMSDILSKEADRLAEEIYDMAGEEFNINSPKQLGYILFEKLAIPPIKKNKTGYSTDAEVLEQLAASYPIAVKLLEYRTYTKLKSTYADGLWQLIDPVSGKIHTSFKQTVTATGRLSSVAPNLQNIPVRMEVGRQIRQVFVASKPDHLLIAGDYNQIELRILAHVSQDEKLIEAFVHGEDIHAKTAAEVLDMPIEQVTRELRRQAKAVNFGIVYGISDYGLSRDLGISRADSKAYIEKYFARYPKVDIYQKQTIKQGERDGYVSTLLGRRRYLPELKSRNFNLRSFAQRMAINTPIQGSAADIIKIAMINIAQKIKENSLESKMILQVHDELIFDVPVREKAIMIPLIKNTMESAMVLSVPIKVDLKGGKDWYNMTNID
ncbi:MAG: DNA polymerase I [Bacillota bacterium]|jgi:DNA polymerase-1